jgi:hypothetical protein
MSSSRTPSSAANQDNDSFRQIAIVISIILLMAYGLIDYFRYKKIKHEFQNKRDDEGFTKEDRFKKDNIWNNYSALRLNPLARITNHTELFFNEIDKTLENKFKSSTNQIIQFGVCNGEYVKNIASTKNRKIIGYDYSSNALVQLKNKKNIETRLVNLNAIDENNKLYYQKELEDDFSEISDVLLIRILEYLKPEAAKLLMISIMDLAKPGSFFYLEISSPPSDKADSSGMITMLHSLKRGTISSLFTHRNDIRIKSLDTTKADVEEGNTLERLIIKKT